MAVQFKTSGTVLFKVSGTVALDAACCCEECCTFDPTRELFLTIDQFTLDGGETCDAGCAGFGVTAKANFGGVQSDDSPVSWFTEACADDDPYRIAYTHVCEEGVHYINMYSGGLSAVHDGCADENEFCFISLGGVGNYLLGDGTAVCDPFYIQGTVDIVVYESDGVTQCATGSIRITISE